MSDGGAPRAPRVVLGVVDGLHDAGAALVVDGRLVAAANEERFTRMKLQGGMPRRSIEAVLRSADVAAEDVEAVAVGGRATPTLMTRWVRPLQRLYARSLGICFDRPWHPVDVAADLVRYRLGWTRGRGSRLAGLLAASAVEHGLPKGLRGKPVVLVDHHVAHAESARRTAGSGTWLVVTADAHGDGRSLTVHLGEEGKDLALLHEEGVETSLGAFYAYVTRALGFLPGRHEGKVLGLSARGDASRVVRPFPFAWDGDALRYDGRWGIGGSRDLRPLQEAAREDVAAWVQRGTEEILLAGIRRWIGKTGASQVAVAGGVFANVLLNGKVAALEGVRRLHVFPHMGDGGLAAGAALLVADAPALRLDGVFLGPTLPEEADGLPEGLREERVEDPDRALVEELVRGKPVARVVGEMEYGPRALGHRSILAPAGDPALTARMNDALRRDDFMPFAPVLTAEAAAEAFDVPAAADALRFMTVALPAREAFRRACPAAVHVDGTARPQVVRREEDPALHALLVAYAARTGAPALLNTSFNVHEEPIVNGPKDAVATFVAAGLRAMRLGGRILRNPASNGRWGPG